MVRKAREQARIPYAPATDYWRGFRKALLAWHREGESIDALMALLENASPKKSENYTRRADSYLKWLGRKTVTWFEPERRIWDAPELGVNMNPELGLEINGKRHIMKLYLRNERLTKIRLSAALAMLGQAYADQIDDGATVGLLDLTNGKFFAANRADRNQQALLAGEASAFAAIWQLLEAQDAVAA